MSFGIELILIVHVTIINNYYCNEHGDLWVGWNPNRPTTAIRFSKEHRHNPVMI